MFIILMFTPPHTSPPPEGLGVGPTLPTFGRYSILFEKWYYVNALAFACSLKLPAFCFLKLNSGENFEPQKNLATILSLFLLNSLRPKIKKAW